VESVKEQRICVKFCFKVRKTSAETHSLLHEAYKDDAMSQTMTNKRFTRFMAELRQMMNNVDDLLLQD
jgi:quinol monooxygenase YgiN